MLVSYQWLTDYTGADIPSPQEVAELLTFHSFEIEAVTEVENDTVIDVDVLPNRSSDCLSHRGIARELATLLQQPLVHDPLRQSCTLPALDTISVDVTDTDACDRFTAVLLENVTVQPSPEWLQTRLRALGQRPINNIVDATNYVMYALGQPLHAYDADVFPESDGRWKFQIRPARPEETIDLLGEGENGGERQLTLRGGETLIVDGSSDVPMGLAGVKGGRYAGVTPQSKRVIIEAAHFDPVRTRRTARANNIVIDASKRFENNPSVALPPYAQQEIATLLADIAGATVVGMVDVYPAPTPPPTVTVSPVAVNGLLGLSLSDGEMSDILTRVGCTVEMQGDTWLCTGPFERTDLQIEADFIEEIGRVYGYERVAAVPVVPVPLPAYNALHYYGEKVREALRACGFSEVITSSFRKKDQIKLHSSLASDKNHLRSSLRKNLAEALAKNAPWTDLLGTDDTRLFEIGTVMSKGENGVEEHVALALAVQSKVTGYSGKEDAVVATAQEAVATALGIDIDWQTAQGVGETNFSALVARLPAPTAYTPVTPVRPPIQYQPFSVYPTVTRDIALWVAEGTAPEDVEALLNETAGPLRARTRLFDEFTKDGRTSYAFRLVFQSHEKTLDGSEVDACMQAVYDAVAKAGWEVR